jgi:hypothetical protein
MASFDRSTTVLRFPSRKGGLDDRPAVSRIVLWPVLGWRVLAPRPRPRALNIAQKAVLGLLVAGLKLDPIAEHLALDRELVALIILELADLGLSDTLGRPTPIGLTTLDQESLDPAEETVAGWVFSDAFSGTLWPTFVDGDLPLASTEQDQDGWQQLVASRGSGYRERTFTILPRPDQVVSERPRDMDVLKAARSQQRRDDLDQVPLARRVLLAKRVSFIADQPDPLLLATRCVRTHAGDWLALDPIHGDDNRGLREQVHLRLDQHAGLRDWLRQVIAGEDSATDMKSLKQQAEWAIEHELTVGIRDHRDVYDALVAMRRSLLECQRPDAPEDKWNDAIVKTQIAVEGALLETLPPQVARQAQQRFQLRTGKNEDPEFNKQWLESAARDLGFATPLPKGLLHVRGGKVRSVLESRKGTVRPVLLACLLAAAGDANHPLRRLAGPHPDILARIHLIGEWRDPASHYTRRTSGDPGPRRPSLSQLEDGVRTAIEIARQLLLRT